MEHYFHRNIHKDSARGCWDIGCSGELQVYARRRKIQGHRGEWKQPSEEHICNLSNILWLREHQQPRWPQGGRNYRHSRKGIDKKSDEVHQCFCYIDQWIVRIGVFLDIDPQQRYGDTKWNEHIEVPCHCDPEIAIEF